MSATVFVGGEAWSILADDQVEALARLALVGGLVAAAMIAKRHGQLWGLLVAPIGLMALAVFPAWKTTYVSDDSPQYWCGPPVGTVLGYSGAGATADQVSDDANEPSTPSEECRKDARGRLWGGAVYALILVPLAVTALGPRRRNREPQDVPAAPSPIP